MDAHTHLPGGQDDWRQDQLDYLKKPLAEQAIRATVHARRTLLAGFTTVRDLGSSDLIDAGLRNSINSGVVPGPRMLVAINAIGARGGHCDGTGGFRPELLKEPGPEQGVVNGPDEVRAAVRFDTKHGADVIKTCATGSVLSEADAGGLPADDPGRAGCPGRRGARPRPGRPLPTPTGGGCARRAVKWNRLIRARIVSR
jgi:imidazolonepropionase-like amidohydrolase